MGFKQMALLELHVVRKPDRELRFIKFGNTFYGFFLMRTQHIRELFRKSIGLFSKLLIVYLLGIWGGKSSLFGYVTTCSALSITKYTIRCLTCKLILMTLVL
jgi:hypothetical protein